LPNYDLDKIKFTTDAPTFEKAIALYESSRTLRVHYGASWSTIPAVAKAMTGKEGRGATSLAVPAKNSHIGVFCYN